MNFYINGSSWQCSRNRIYTLSETRLHSETAETRLLENCHSETSNSFLHSHCYNLFALRYECSRHATLTQYDNRTTCPYRSETQSHFSTVYTCPPLFIQKRLNVTDH